ncbi:MAG: trehalase family glycosidase, partial [Candidatus Hodarchaeota archaeon]
ILIFTNKLFWIGYIISLIFRLILIFLNNFELFFLFTLGIILYFWYIFIYLISRSGCDLILSKSPLKPYIKIKDPIIQEGYSEVFKWLEINLNAPKGNLKHRWAIPAAIFMSCYLWDSAFISLVWKYWDQNIASEILLPLLDNQTEDGRIPHFVSFSHKSEKIQPPLIAWAISNLKVSNEYLKNAYSKLKKFNEWLYRNRRLKNGLFFWEHSYESGIDNSPRFTDRSERNKKDLTRLAVIDLNSFMVLQNKSLIKIARELQKQDNKDNYETDIAEFHQKNEELVELIQKYLWDEETGLYLDYDIVDEKRIVINTIASFFPLIAEIPTENQAKRLIKHLESPYEYNTKIPLPSVALNDNYFEKDMWRGPVWINTAYLVIKGLEKYQRYKLSGEFAFRIIQGVFETWKNEGSFYEYYNPERYDLKELTRKKGNFYKQLTLGRKPVKNFVGWTGLVNSLLVESVIGYDLFENTIQPRLPEELKGKKIVLGFPSYSSEIELSYENEKNISIALIDLKSKNKEIIKKCSLYQKISLNS